MPFARTPADLGMSDRLVVSRLFFDARRKSYAPNTRTKRVGMRQSDIADLRSVVLDGHPRPVLLLGAGASVTSGVPLVRGLVDLIGRHAYCRKFRRDPDDPALMRSDWYPWVSGQAWFDPNLELQELYARHILELLAPRERRRQFLQEHVLVSPENASSGYLALASLVGKRRIHSILTTNFDTLAIDSCKRDPSASSVIQIQSPAEAHFISTDPGVSQVIHVHGVVDQYADLNLTEEVAGLDGDFASRIIPLICDHPLIVIGYRGAEPSVYRDLLLAAASTGPVPLPHGVYWCRRPRDGALHSNIEELAERCGGNFAVVEIDGFDELMAALDEDVSRVPSYRPSDWLPFDGRPVSAGSAVGDDDVDWDLVARTLDDDALGRLALPVPPPGPGSARDRLRSMNLLSDMPAGEVLTNAGRILFSSAKPIVADVDVDGVSRSVEGNLFEVYDAVSEFIAGLNQPYRLKGPESVDVRPYPPLAIKELLVNSLVHRDYEVPAAIDVSIDSQRLRLGNPGGLLDPDDIDALGERSVRHYRNPSLSEVLYATGLMDKYGSGLVDVRAWARAGGAVATFDVGDDNTRFEAVLTSRPDSRDGAATVVPAGSYEVFYVNALRVRVPDEIWVGPTQARRARQIYAAHPGEAVPRFVLDGRNLLTFSDVSDGGNPLHGHVDASERHAVEEICSTPVGEALVLELLNWMFERHMQENGVEVHHKKGRIWFHIDEDGSDRVVEYQARLRTATRTVARLKNANSRRPYFEHQAMAWSFVHVDGEWLLTIEPTWIFTIDGRAKLETRRRTTQLSTRKMSNERNLSVLNHVFFWAWAICGNADLALLDDGSDAVWVEHRPLKRHEAGMVPSQGTGVDDIADLVDLEDEEVANEGDLDDDGFDELDDDLEVS
jgi:hypothetical protein